MLNILMFIYEKNVGDYLSLLTVILFKVVVSCNFGKMLIQVNIIQNHSLVLRLILNTSNFQGENPKFKKLL